MITPCTDYDSRKWQKDLSTKCALYSCK